MKEMLRIDFLVERDGIVAAIAWVKRTLHIYRSSVINHSHFAGTREYRRGFIESYLGFKHWLAQQK